MLWKTLEKYLSLKVRLLSYSTIVVILVATLISSMFLYFHKRDAWNEYNLRTNSTTKHLSNDLELLVLLEDKEGIERLLEYIVTLPDVVSTSVYNQKNEPLVKVDGTLTDVPKESLILSISNIVVKPTEIMDEMMNLPAPKVPETIGRVEVVFSTYALQASQSNMLNLVVLMTIIVLLLTAVVDYFFITGITRPLNNLVHASQAIADGDLEQRIHLQGGNEIGKLATAFNKMIIALRKRDETLTEHHEKLSKSYEDLQEAHDALKTAHAHLVRSEKMVFLGELVAGVAHEINTPIGIGVTSASYLASRTKEVVEQFDNNGLKKSSLEEYFAECQQCSGLILKNLNRTSSLIQSFKMVSADQTYDEVRKFNIKEYLDDIIQSLGPKIKRTCHSFKIVCDGVIISHNNPGAFAQVITNLIMNSLAHAYDDNDEGEILIEVSERKQKVSLTYSDDGKGIPEEHLTKIFNPFFTTKRGQGGTGLGLNIVYNIVHKTLGGGILCKSEIGKGTTFYIEFPVENPFDKQKQDEQSLIQ